MALSPYNWVISYLRIIPTEWVMSPLELRSPADLPWGMSSRHRNQGWLYLQGSHCGDFLVRWLVITCDDTTLYILYYIILYYIIYILYIYILYIYIQMTLWIYIYIIPYRNWGFGTLLIWSGTFLRKHDFINTILNCKGICLNDLFNTNCNCNWDLFQKRW